MDITERKALLREARYLATRTRHVMELVAAGAMQPDAGATERHQVEQLRGVVAQLEEVRDILAHEVGEEEDR